MATDRLQAGEAGECTYNTLTRAEAADITSLLRCKDEDYYRALLSQVPTTYTHTGK